MTDPDDPVRLNEYDRDEWMVIARRLRPDWSEDDFAAAWDKFVAMNKSKKLQ